MDGITQHYIIDLSSNNNFVQISAVQGDGRDVRYVEIELKEYGQSYDLNPDEADASIIGTKPDTKEIWNACEITEEGYIIVEITQQMVAVAGRGEYQIMLTDTMGNRQLKTFPFFLLVTKAAYDPTYIQSTDEFQKLAISIDSAARSQEAAKESAEEAKQSELDSEAWAVGQRDGEDVSPSDDTYHNNSKYYSEVSDAESEDCEAWAVGERDGVPVTSTDETYHNNSKYYSEVSDAESKDAEAWAVGQRDGVDVTSTDDTYHNNSKYYAGQAETSADNASTSESNALDYSNISKSYAVGTNNVTRPNDETDNSKYYSEISKYYFEAWDSGAVNLQVDVTNGHLYWEVTG